MKDFDLDLSFSKEDQERLKVLGKLAGQAEMDDFIEIFYSTITQRSDNPLVEDHVEEIQKLLVKGLRALFTQAPVDEQTKTVEELVELLVSLDVDYETINEAYFKMYFYLLQYPDLQKQDLGTLIKTWYQWLSTTVRIFYRELEQSKSLVEEISTPIAVIWDNIISVPVVGHMDSHRFMVIEENLLDAVERYSARFVIIDVAGLDYLDSDVASYFMKMIQAINLMGTDVIMVGVGSAISRAFVRLDVDISSLRLETFATFKQGLTYAFEQMNVVTD